MEGIDEHGGGGGFSEKEKITDILDRRHKERKNQIESAKLERQKDADESEAIDYFEASLNDEVRKISTRLDAVIASDCDRVSTFESVQKDISSLQRYLSTSTFFLNEYKIKVCQNTINELCKRLDALKNELIPKKKFGFKSKKTVKVHQDSRFALGKAADFTDPQSNGDRLKWTLSERKNQLIVLSRSSVDDQTITASGLTDCIVRLEGHSGALQFTKLKNCLVLCGPTSRSIFLDDCVDCKFVVACQQLRCHRSRNCHLYLKVTSRAIIEDCSQIQVAEYNWSYDGLANDFVESGLDVNVNNWNELDDFDWLATDKPSPNWSLLPEDQLVSDWKLYQHQFQTKNCCKTFE
ncbi:tubulin-specific chaperone C [Sabethes cyaneus]|uniref:tubulin-specific chaperone C n=1 Tax=Sabethes cyaneus TaxID=53552 RepID=UPI00237DD765|nr:tubulin-specific chaperone C [Sabethes cyaneus]XP_053692830.1 tubulin-specific chaperone C [Sabethes cyaneus]